MSETNLIHDEEKNEETLAETDQENITGGLNPQPLPPIVIDHI